MRPQKERLAPGLIRQFGNAILAVVHVVVVPAIVADPWYVDAMEDHARPLRNRAGLVDIRAHIGAGEAHPPRIDGFRPGRGHAGLSEVRHRRLVPKIGLPHLIADAV